MRDNLVFAVIPEDNREDTEEVLQEILQRKYKLDTRYHSNESTGWREDWIQRTTSENRSQNLPTLKTGNSSERELPKNYEGS